jgi:tetratricopeptide (TPR) repeat protein
LLAYVNAFHLGIARDGNFLMAEPRTNALTLQNLKLIWQNDYWYPGRQDWLYRPLTTTSFLFTNVLFTGAARLVATHALNILLHALNVWLVFLLARRLFRQAEPAVFAAGLWAVHPISTEVVANIAGRADLLASAALLGALLIYQQVPTAKGRLLPISAGMLGLAAAAIFSKETGVILVGLMLLWDLTWWSGARDFATRLPLYCCALVPVAVWACLRMRVFQSLPERVAAELSNPLLAAGFWSARWTAVKVLGIDFTLLAFPLHLSSDRSFNQIPIAGVGSVGAWLSLAVAAGCLAFVLIRRRQEPILFWAAGFFGLALLPVSNLIVLIGSIMSERFLYLPSVGFAIALIATGYRVLPSRAVPIVLGIAIALCGARTFARNPDWDNDFTLATHDVNVAPRSWQLRSEVANFAFQRDRDVDRAIREHETIWSWMKALPPARSYPQIPENLSILYMLKAGETGGSARQGRPQMEGIAERAWENKALQVLLAAREITSASQQEVDAADLRRGRAPMPRLRTESVDYRLGDVYLALGRHAEALASYRQGQLIDPTAAEGYDRQAQAYAAAGDPRNAALAALEKAFVLGFNPEAIASLSARYGALPDGACAVVTQNGISIPNFGCPRLRADACPALSGLARLFTEARQPAAADRFARQGQAGYRCTP